MSSSSISSEVGLRSGVEVGSEAVPDTSPRLRLRNGDGTTDQPIVKSSPTETRFCLIEAYKPFAVRPENPTATHCARKSPKNRLTAASELSAPRHRRVSDQTISTSAPSVFGAAGARAIAQAGVTWARRIRLRDLFRLSAASRLGRHRRLTDFPRHHFPTRQCGAVYPRPRYSRLFFGKLFEIEIVNLTQRYRPNLNKIMRVSYSFSVLTHPLYSASFGELYARSQSWYASSGPQTAKLIIHLESIRSDLLSALRRRVKIHQKVGRRLSNRGWGFARNSRHGERMCPNGTTPYP